MHRPDLRRFAGELDMVNHAAWAAPMRRDLATRLAALTLDRAAGSGMWLGSAMRYFCKKKAAALAKH
jgi:hypothetical protein